MSDLWLLAGQSNMEGCGKLTDIEQPSENVRCFAHGDYWQVAEEPLHWLSEALDDVHHAGSPPTTKDDRSPREYGAGLGLTFAKTINERTGIKIDLLPVAHGGTSMAQWSPDLKHEGGKSLYGALLRRTALALKTGGNTTLRGILWYQGESDTGADTIPLYKERMIRWVEELRRDLDSPTLPFFMVQLGCFRGDIPADPWEAKKWSEIKEIQRLLPLSIPHSAVVPAIDLSLDDCIHISARGLKRLGKRLANVALDKVYGINSPTGLQVKSVALEGQKIRVSYDGVAGRLVTPDPDGRVSGFGLSFGGGQAMSDVIYNASIDPSSPNDVLLHIDFEVSSDIKLYYGGSIHPVCQLTDQADMAAPAFGPVDIV